MNKIYNQYLELACSECRTEVYSLPIAYKIDKTYLFSGNVGVRFLDVKLQFLAKTNTDHVEIELKALLKQLLCAWLNCDNVELGEQRRRKKHQLRTQKYLDIVSKDCTGFNCSARLRKQKLTWLESSITRVTRSRTVMRFFLFAAWELCGCRQQ